MQRSADSQRQSIILVRQTAQLPLRLEQYQNELAACCLLQTQDMAQARCMLREKKPSLVILQNDKPGLDDMRAYSVLAAENDAVFLLLVRQSTYPAVWQMAQRAGICVMSWPADGGVLAQTLRNLLLVKKRMTSMQERTDELQMQLADLKRIQKAKSLLQRQLGMSEQDAHRWIEKAAMDRCVKKREIAETVIRLYDT